MNVLNTKILTVDGLTEQNSLVIVVIVVIVHGHPGLYDLAHSWCDNIRNRRVRSPHARHGDNTVLLDIMS